MMYKVVHTLASSSGYLWICTNIILNFYVMVSFLLIPATGTSSAWPAQTGWGGQMRTGGDLITGLKQYQHAVYLLSYEMGHRHIITILPHYHWARKNTKLDDSWYHFQVIRWCYGWEPGLAAAKLVKLKLLGRRKPGGKACKYKYIKLLNPYFQMPPTTTIH